MRVDRWYTLQSLSTITQKTKAHLTLAFRLKKKTNTHKRLGINAQFIETRSKMEATFRKKMLLSKRGGGLGGVWRFYMKKKKKEKKQTNKNQATYLCALFVFCLPGPKWARSRRVTRSKARLHGMNKMATACKDFVVCTVAYTPKPCFRSRLLWWPDLVIIPEEWCFLRRRHIPPRVAYSHESFFSFCFFLLVFFSILEYTAVYD